MSISFSCPFMGIFGGGGGGCFGEFEKKNWGGGGKWTNFWL